MKKYIFVSIFVIFVFIFSFPFAISTPTITSPTTSVQNVVSSHLVNDPILQMVVLSDIHMNLGNDNNTHFSNALQDLNEIAPHYNVLAVDGDLTDKGLLGEYQLFNDTLKSYMNPLAKTFMTMGNQDYGDTNADSSLQKMFMKEEHTPNLYYDKWFNGYHFISIAGEQSPKTLADRTRDLTVIDGAYISDKQISWLSDNLKDHADKNKPIFVFLHQPLKDTVYGSKWNAGFNENKIYDLLSHYPQVIFISGHSEYPLNHTDGILQGQFTMVNAGGVDKVRDDNGLIPNLSQGILINVYSSHVDIKLREFSNHTWIRTFTIPLTNGKWVDKDGHSYIMGEDGKPQTGFIRYDGNLHYSDSNGIVQGGWKNINQKLHYFLPNGIMSFGWLNVDGKWFYLNRKGEVVTGWQNVADKTYYFHSDGSAADTSETIDGVDYQFNSDGSLQLGVTTTTGH